jgi:hypothetical protein
VRNSTVHGAFSSSWAPIARGPFREDPEAVADFVAEVAKDLRPRNRLKEAAAFGIARLVLQQRRVEALEIVLMSGAGRQPKLDDRLAGGDEDALLMEMDLAEQVAEWAEARQSGRSHRDGSATGSTPAPDPCESQPAFSTELLARYMRTALGITGTSNLWDAKREPTSEEDWERAEDLMVEDRLPNPDKLAKWLR